MDNEGNKYPKTIVKFEARKAWVVIYSNWRQKEAEELDNVNL
jgi:hypothetical protein